MEIKSYSIEDKKLASLHLEGVDLKKRKVDVGIFSCAVRALMQNGRQGTVGCKARGDVSLSGKKPWRQKGTGRARAGTSKSPLWRKGGVTFGPQLRVRKKKIAAGHKKLAFNNILFSFLDDKRIFCIKGMDFKDKKISTKSAREALKGMGLDSSKIVLFLPFGGGSSDGGAANASFRNLSSVFTVPFASPDVLNLSKGDCWVFLERDVDLFKEMVSKRN
jgi:large subunit ribosomal protein L4